MDQIINMVTIAFEGMVLFYFQKNKGKTERKSIILFAFLWLIMFFTEWKLNLEGYAEELFYLVITILAARTVFLKKPINATMYGVSFMAVRHLSYIIVYFLVICLVGKDINIYKENLAMQGIVYILAIGFELGAVYLIKKHFTDFLETEYEMEGVYISLGAMILWMILWLTEDRLLKQQIAQSQNEIMPYVIYIAIAGGIFYFAYRIHRESNNVTEKTKELKSKVLNKYGSGYKISSEERLEQVSALTEPLERIFQDKTHICQETGIQLQRDGDLSFLEKIGTENAILLIDSLIEYAMSVCKESGKEESHIFIIGKDAITRIRCECSCDLEFLKGKKPSKQQNLLLRTVSNIAGQNKGWVKQENKRGCLIITIKLDLL